MKTRRDILLAFGAGTFTASLGSFAQQSGRLWRIGFISTRAARGPNEEIFEQALRELGYVEGKTAAIEWRFGKGQSDLYFELARELVRAKVDCIVVNGIMLALAAKQATTTIPIVMGAADDDPVRHGVVASLARPGGNITGNMTFGPDLAGKRLELLKEILPKASRFAILWDRNSLTGASHFKQTDVAARALGVKLQSLDVQGPEGEVLEDAFRAAGKGRAQALVVVGSGFINSHQARIASLAAKTRLPVMYTSTQFVRADGLMSYAPTGGEGWRRAASYVDRILKGAKPGDLPIEQPVKFELVVNLKAAKRIGLAIPPGVLARADRVIE